MCPKSLKVTEGIHPDGSPRMSHKKYSAWDGIHWYAGEICPGVFFFDIVVAVERFLEAVPA